MTTLDKLRELLSTRPVHPGLDDLARWWTTSGPLITELLADLEGIDADLVAERAAHRRTMDERANLRVQLDGRIRWQVDAVAHLRTWSGLFDAAVAMREGHEGCVTEPACGDCFRCRFDAAVDEAMKAVAADSPGSVARDVELEHLRAAARRFVALVDDLGAFVNDNDPRVMAIAGPLGAAQADLWAALGLDLDQEHARLQADIASRCAVCGWPLAEKPESGCVRGNCSHRPRPEHLYAPDRAEREAAEAAQRDRMEAGHA